jgi:hypothetical protein
MLVIRCRPDGAHSVTSLGELLASPFTGESLEKGTNQTVGAA